MEGLGKLLIVAGIALVAIGALLTFTHAVLGAKDISSGGHATQHVRSGVSWLGRLPGDLRIERPGVRVYIPITTSILLSVLLSVILYVVSRMRH